MIDVRQKWNRKYREGGFPTEPSRLVADFSALATGYRALDVAAGSGRHSLWLAERGFRVDAVDISETGLRMMGDGQGRIQRICADLDDYTIRPASYDLIVNVRFLDRRMFPDLREGLRPGGVLIFESFLEGPEGSAGGKFRREFLLRPNELLHAFLPLRVIHYGEREEESDGGSPSRTASLVGIRKPLL
ncbi:MAG: class I SAM-dependent methyltransferase [Desulfobacterales bacterium]